MIARGEALALQGNADARADRNGENGEGEDDDDGNGNAEKSTGQQASSPWLVKELQAGHIPFASQPEETAQCLVGFAEEFMQVV